MKILVLTTILFSKKRNGGEVASQCFIDALRESGHQVSVVGYFRKNDVFEEEPKDTFIVDSRYTETSQSKLYTIFWLVLSFLINFPYSSAKYYSSTYINKVKKLLESGKYDIVIVDHSQLAWLQPFLKGQDKLIALVHNVEHEMYIELSEKANKMIAKKIYTREANLIKAKEDSLATAAKQVWTLTQHDAEYFSKFNQRGGVRIFDLAPSSAKLQGKPLDKNYDIGIIGSWAWKANVEALQWFLEKVYPHLPTNISIHVAGKEADWLTDKYSNINYRGVVPDAQEFMAQAKVVAIPTLSGGGIQIKTLDAIASGSAIVATPVALRGISNPPKTIQVAETPEDFANLLVAAIASPSMQQAFDEAINWYRTRRDNFVTDVASAIRDL